MRLFMLFFALFLFVNAAFCQQFYVLSGSYTTGNNTGKGIEVLRFDATNGTLKPVSSFAIENPSYLTVADHGKLVYSVSEQEGGKVGEVAAFRFNQQNGQLQLLNKQSVNGKSPCSITVDNQLKWVFTANYSSGNVSALPLLGDGSIDTLQQLAQHVGSSKNLQRQAAPHAHAVLFSPGQKELLVTDLGTDKIYRYRFQSNKPAPLQLVDSIVTSSPGNGPRHLVFHPKGKFLYVVNELSGSVDVFKYRKTGSTLVQTIQTDSTTRTFKGSADIHFSPDGKFLYASNRGAVNSICIYKVNAKTGQLQIVGYETSKIATPRNFVIDPTGNYLLVANQSKNNIVVFKRDFKTGLIAFTGITYQTGTPVCLKMIAAGH
jgi:6-phosphogluconolactonase